MIRSMLSISAGLAAVSVVLATLWISHGPRQQMSQGKQASAPVPISQQRPTGSGGQPVRTIATGPSTGSALSSTLSQQHRGGVDSALFAVVPTSDSASTQPGKLRSLTDAGSPTRLADVAPSSGLGTGTVVNSASEPSATGGSVDLNSASVEQLNALGAGMIGKRVIEFRPYASVEDLVTRRVLKRADYETIRAAVTAR
jgi:DNA uptake protein ComE-like DNA-binding protein